MGKNKGRVIKTKTLKNLTRLEKISLGGAFAITVVFFIHYISTVKFRNFLIKSYQSLQKYQYHDWTILFPHFYVWQAFWVVLAAIYLILPS